jgi:hypothetical protein
MNLPPDITYYPWRGDFLARTDRGDVYLQRAFSVLSDIDLSRRTTDGIAARALELGLLVSFDGSVRT